ncbi:MAG: decaprenyl-phosphate phosphoribosyltransferase [Segetibacter sp.]
MMLLKNPILVLKKANYAIAILRPRDWVRKINYTIKMLRPKHWVKNLYLFAPMFFSGAVPDAKSFFSVAAGFILFSSAASSIYILNDIVDLEKDKLHPKKRLRPLAAGCLDKNIIIITGIILLILTLYFSFFLNFNFFLLVILYILINISYCFALKKIPIVDISIISIGFIIRVLAGGELALLEVSQWLMIMIYLLSLFLALGKRRDDLVLIQSKQADQNVRTSIKGYNFDFVQVALSIMATVIIVCYIMYITSSEVVERFNNKYAYFNLVFVVSGVLRYLQLAYLNNNTGSPVRILLTDIFIQICVLCWVLSFVYFLYIK